MIWMYLLGIVMMVSFISEAKPSVSRFSPTFIALAIFWPVIAWVLLVLGVFTFFVKVVFPK